MATFVTHSPRETFNLAANFAKQYQDKGGIIALIGDLGSGKTTFVQGIALGLGITEKILSPTFVFIRTHQLPNSHRLLYHVDLYRLEDHRNINQLGLDEILANPENIILIEWAEKIKKILPKTATVIRVDKSSEETRRIIINAADFGALSEAQ